MTYDEVVEMAEETGLPVAYDHFAEGESPEPPFLVFLFPSSDNFSAVICMADRSFTLFPAAEVPMKKLYALPDVAFLGPSRVRNKPLKIPIVVFSLLLIEH